MANSVVLDASALIALMRNEKGAEVVAACLSSAMMSTVSEAEVQAKLVAAGLNEQEAWWHITEVGCESVAFDEEQARIAGGLVKLTRPYGLSAGDWACLALALKYKATVYTTDRSWKNLRLGIEVEVIR